MGHLHGKQFDEQGWVLLHLSLELLAGQVPRLLSHNLHHHLLNTHVTVLRKSISHETEKFCCVKHVLSACVFMCTCFSSQGDQLASDGDCGHQVQPASASSCEKRARVESTLWTI